MIISRAPLRISFVGGGTDLRSFYVEEPGQVLSVAIDKYIYVVVKRQAGIVEHKYRINWSQVEFRDKIEDIKHPIIREALTVFDIDFPIEISTFSDIPANTGLGSSSTFAVALVHALYALKGEMVSKHTLATLAADIEVNQLKRVMGKQDHFASAYGNLNIFSFNVDESVSVEPVFYKPSVRASLEGNMLLFYTCLKRDASEILTVQNRVTKDRRDVLRKMKGQVSCLRDALSGGLNLTQIGDILHEAWEMKKGLADEISNSKIDSYYELALKAGATGGKLLGAGGGGFLMLYVEPQHQSKVIESLASLYCLRVKFDTGGACITYYDNDTI